MTMPLVEYARRGLRLEGIPVFDIHAHIGKMSTLESPPFHEQMEEMARLGIARVAISSIHALHGDYTRGNEEVAVAIRAYPGRILGYCHINANYPKLMLPELERCFAQQGFRGIKVYQFGTPFDHPLYEPVWDFAHEHQAPVLAHTWGGDLTGFDVAAVAHPEVAFIAGHAGSAFAYERYLTAAEHAPNLYLDLTYSREHTNMIEYFVERIGAERLLWGIGRTYVLHVASVIEASFHPHSG